MNDDRQPRYFVLLNEKGREVARGHVRGYTQHFDGYGYYHRDFASLTIDTYFDPKLELPHERLQQEAREAGMYDVIERHLRERGYGDKFPWHLYDDYRSSEMYDPLLPVLPTKPMNMVVVKHRKKDDRADALAYSFEAVKSKATVCPPPGARPAGRQEGRQVRVRRQRDQRGHEGPPGSLQLVWVGAMKVIKSGAKFAPFEVTCVHCHAQLQVESLEDLRRRYYADARESMDQLEVTCPECDGCSAVASLKVPTHLLDSIKKVAP